MTDTSPEFERLYRERIMERSGAERLEMGAEMFDSALLLMRAGIRATSERTLTEIEVRERVIERLYGDEFSAAVRREVARRGVPKGDVGTHGN